MNRKLFVTIFALAALLLTSFAVVNTSRRATPADNTRSDYWQRHPMTSIPVTGAIADLRGSDYFQRHIAARGVDSTDYAARHPQLDSAQDRDTTDYFGRNPQARIVVGSNAPMLDLTDYGARHPELSPTAVLMLAANDYFQRHPQAAIVISAKAPSADLTDYAARHPGPSLIIARQVDTTDYYFRQQALGQ